jgi:hypothetical protein
VRLHAPRQQEDYVLVSKAGTFCTSKARKASTFVLGA